MNLVAIDFETADNGADSACAIGMVRIVDGQVVAQETHLIRPPRRNFFYTHIHGITWDDVAGEKTFADLWPTLNNFISDADYLVAHNAAFDRGVMNACNDAAGLTPPVAPWLCTVKLARQVWNVRPTKLPDVCRYLVIPLNHHNAASDALACAKIVVAAMEDDFDITTAELGTKTKPKPETWRR
ncbi:MAG: 3'-5' exonuclease [Alphaproteobacteria bacterium]|jgi:DNA polymerase III subunit epsilon|nr:3'-5' exonuclease [Alphaproteobacteria bacterium]MBT4017026.1 3'-5' exonuclease [Alphaproteobacteria bacterium]MBT5160962.1 3'-5' exonuclease [Alphaproteobacteria bacterium]MBT5917982.1 3'-5' exonuclease [Alphaproteobacteria bacterium]MBT6387713.1 3'-5' exonuclease [Alphaproteobacteria bacterium]